MTYALTLAVQGALDTIYPKRCLGCGAAVEDDAGLCPTCWRDTPFVAGTTCDSCGTPLPGDRTHAHETCDACMAAPPPWDRGRAALLYEERARKLVHHLKARAPEDLTRAAARWMAQAGADLIGPDTLLAPVPLHWRRRTARRFNQAAALGAVLGKLTGARHVPDLLRRHTHAAKLERAGLAERFATLDGSMALHPARSCDGAQVVLIADVMTSGATLSEATRAVRAGGAARVDVLVLARATRRP